MEVTAFLDIMLCSVVKVYQRFSGKNCLHLQGRRVNRESKQQASVSLLDCLLVGLISSCNLIISVTSYLKVQAFKLDKQNTHTKQVHTVIAPSFELLKRQRMI